VSNQAVAWISHPDCLLHSMGAAHPECPQRLQVIEDRLRASGLDLLLQRYTATEAGVEALDRVHDPQYVRRVLATRPAPGVLQLNVMQLQAFQRLLTTLGYDGAFAKRIALQMRAGLMHSATRFQTPTLPGAGTAATAPMAGGDMQAGNFTDEPGMSDGDRGPAPLVMTSVDNLLDVDGVTPEMVARLRPFVTVLPTTTPVNMNTAPAEVIAALVPGMSVSSAQALVSRRETVFFRNVGDVQLALRGAGAPNVTIDSSLVDVNSSYFIVHGRIQHDRAEVDRTSLVYRDPTTHSTRVVRIRDQL